MKKIAAVCTAIVLSGSAVFGSVIAANADDEVPTDTTTVQEVVETPEFTTDDIQTPPSADSFRVSSVVAFVPHEESARWLLPASWPKATTPTYQSAIFPQTVLTGEPSCNRWSQDDIYQIDNQAEQNLFNSLDDDGILTMGEDGSIYKSHVFTYGGDCPKIELCVENGVYPTSTNILPDGWSLKPGATNAGWVDGGLLLDASDGLGSSWAIKTLPAGTHLSDLGDLTTTFVGAHGQYWGGIILEGGDLTAQLHYDDNGRYWTTQSGIFSAVRAGYYQSFPIDGNGADVPTNTPEILSDPLIGTIKIYVNSGQNVTVATQSYLCGSQPFDKAPVVGVPAAFNADPTAPSCGVEGGLPSLGEFENVTLAFDRAYDGPGDYTLTATAINGATFPDDSTVKTRTITVEGALLYTSGNNESDCYVEPKDDEEVVTAGEFGCGDKTLVESVSTTSFVLNVVTGELEAQEPVESTRVRDLTSEELASLVCPITTTDKMPITGTDTVPWFIGGGVLGLLGASLIIFGRRKKNSVVE